MESQHGGTRDDHDEDANGCDGSAQDRHRILHAQAVVLDLTAPDDLHKAAYAQGETDRGNHPDGAVALPQPAKDGAIGEHPQ